MLKRWLTFWHYCRGTPDDANCSFLLTRSATTEWTRKTFLRCVRPANCEPCWRKSACALVSILRRSDQPARSFHEMRGPRFCRWRRSGNGCATWSGQAMNRSNHRKFHRGGGNGAFGARRSPFRGSGLKDLLGRGGWQVAGGPALEIGECAMCESTLSSKRFRSTAAKLAVTVERRRLTERRKQAKIDIHWLE